MDHPKDNIHMNITLGNAGHLPTSKDGEQIHTDAVYSSKGTSNLSVSLGDDYALLHSRKEVSRLRAPPVSLGDEISRLRAMPISLGDDIPKEISKLSVSLGDDIPKEISRLRAPPVSLGDDIPKEISRLRAPPVSLGDEISRLRAPPVSPRIELTQEQSVHLMCNILPGLKKYVAVLDYSQPGTGKTFVASAAATLWRVPIVVVAPKTVEEVWLNMKNNYSVNILHIITYQTLVGRSGHELSHPYLIRTDQNFMPSGGLQRLVQAGVFFIFDEMAAARNHNTLTRKAVHAIVCEIARQAAGGSHSRVLHLSALPTTGAIDQIQSLCNVLGIVISDKYWEYNNREGYILYGLEELIEWCKYMSSKLTLDVLSNNMEPSVYNSLRMREGWTFNPSQLLHMNNKTMPHLIRRLFNKVVQRTVCFQMISQDAKHKELAVKNAYYRVEIKNGHTVTLESESDILLKGREIFREAVEKYLEKRGIEHFQEINRGFDLIGIAMLRSIYYIVHDRLSREPQRKFVIGAWSLKHIYWLEHALKSFGARSLYGDTKQIDRHENIRVFQEDSYVCRVLVVNPTVGGEGISLDDIYGHRPRTLMVIPYHYLDKTVQFSYRVWRKSTRSLAQTEVMLLFLSGFPDQDTILSNLIDRSNNSMDVIRGSRLVLPNQYERADLHLSVESTHFPEPPELPSV